MSSSLRVSLGFTEYPARYTCDGEGLSPPITIEGLSCAYMAMILDDPDAPGGSFTHWLIWNVSARNKVPEGISPVEHPPELPGSTQGLNTDGDPGYISPCPPRGPPHRYVLKVYGLEDPLDLPSLTKRREFMRALGAAVQYGEVMATYQRKGSR